APRSARSSRAGRSSASCTARAWHSTSSSPTSARCSGSRSPRVGSLAPMELEGIGALVAGGASGLGAASARALAQRGARVLVADLDDERGNALADEIGGGFAHVDVTDEVGLGAAVERVENLRLALSCAGIGNAERVVSKRGPAK